MKRSDDQLVGDILAAISAIHRHTEIGPLTNELVLDAVRMRLIEIGEAAKGLSNEFKVRVPEIRWKQVAGMRDRLAHRYFENEIDIIRGTVDNDLAELVAVLDAIRHGGREE